MFNLTKIDFKNTIAASATLMTVGLLSQPALALDISLGPVSVGVGGGNGGLEVGVGVGNGGGGGLEVGVGVGTGEGGGGLEVGVGVGTGEGGGLGVDVGVGTGGGGTGVEVGVGTGGGGTGGGGIGTSVNDVTYASIASNRLAGRAQLDCSADSMPFNSTALNSKPIISENYVLLGWVSNSYISADQSIEHVQFLSDPALTGSPYCIVLSNEGIANTNSFVVAPIQSSSLLTTLASRRSLSN